MAKSRFFGIMILMKKLLVLISVLALSGCAGSAPIDSVSIDVSQILIVGDSVSFDFLLSRNDLGLKTPQPEEGDVIYKEDLPEGLQVNGMSLDGDFLACNDGFAPYRCDSSEIKNDFDLLVSFADGHESKLVVHLNLPDGLYQPEITEPLEKPKKGDSLALKFNDVGADKYEVSVNLCEEYSNNGINPCLEGVEYVLNRDETGVLVLDGNAYMPRLSVEDGVVTLESDYPLHYGVGLEYRVQALKIGELNGMPSYLESESSLSFE